MGQTIGAAPVDCVYAGDVVGRKRLNRQRVPLRQCHSRQAGGHMAEDDCAKCQYRMRWRQAAAPERRQDERCVSRTPAAVVDRFGQPANVENLFLGGHLFLVLSGPSLNDLNLSLLSQRGITTFGVNNAAAVVRPDIWTYGDPTSKFHEAIWRDPGILKLAPFAKVENPIHTKLPDGTFKSTGVRPCDLPGVLGVNRNLYFRPDHWLHEPTVNWGHGNDGVQAEACECRWLGDRTAHRKLKADAEIDACVEAAVACRAKLTPQVRAKGLKMNVYTCLRGLRMDGVTVADCWLCGKREPPEPSPGVPSRHPKILSTMFQAVRLAYYLGFRTIYLLGCDFRMTEERGYAFAETCHPGAVRGNTASYAKMQTMYTEMRPRFEAAGLCVYNCYEESGLTVFDYLPFEEAVADATAAIPERIDTVGWYRDENKRAR